jgi:hypothetical protein
VFGWVVGHIAYQGREVLPLLLIVRHKSGAARLQFLNQFLQMLRGRRREKLTVEALQ